VNTALLLAIGAIASVATGLWDLLSHDARDVLRSVGALEVGLILGTAVETVLPGGLLVGAVSGLIAGYATFDRIVDRRVADLDDEMLDAADSASALLVLHDRVDLVTRPLGGTRRTTSYLSMLFILLLGIALNGMGLAYDFWYANLAGAAIMFWPLARGTRWLAEHDEGRALERRLAEVAEEADPNRALTDG
jgi:hypothetical protein